MVSCEYWLYLSMGSICIHIRVYFSFVDLTAMDYAKILVLYPLYCLSQRGLSVETLFRVTLPRLKENSIFSNAPPYNTPLQ